MRAELRGSDGKVGWRRIEKERRDSLLPHGLIYQTDRNGEGWGEEGQELDFGHMEFKVLDFWEELASCQLAVGYRVWRVRERAGPQVFETP